MIVNVYDVKLASGKYDGVSATAPDNTFDSSKGYYVGFALLVASGESYTCSDDTAGSAVWILDTKYDAQIISKIRELTLTIPKYCNQYWNDDSGIWTFTDLEFKSPNEIVWSGASATGFTDYYYAGDTLYIFNSSRNDNVYDIESITADTLTLAQDIALAMDDDNAVRMFASVFPGGLKPPVAELIVYDIWTRPGLTDGLSAESVGSYSYTKNDISGMNYPSDLLASLSQYKRPKVL